MKAANGHTREEFRRNTPGYRIKESLANHSERKSAISTYFPSRILLVHGIEDDTVPFTATSECARVLRSCGIEQCEEFYAPFTGHQEAVMHLMLGGRVKDFICQWLLCLDDPLRVRSKL